ncbi:MAG: phosphatidate cytidylyltransferase [Gammaproteobacteria bacterium]|nr:phosphatidate cytidylyltransferase [Gammaproteobacteria bacterium]|tara:strand:+ start:1393 stop:2226 length:834 start_codon:yes stop_codon:yes gene_type:complete
MLRARVLTAGVLLPIALLVLFVFPEDAFAFSVGLIVLIGAWEWIRLSGVVNRLVTLNLLIILAGTLVWSYYLPLIHVSVLLSIGCIFWIGAAALVIIYPRSKKQLGGRRMKIGFGLLVLIPAYVALLYLRRHEAHMLLIALLVTIIWAADVGAYFVGRQFGITKLAPHVSPGKSWAGLVGGMVVALIVGMICVLIVQPAGQFFSPIAWSILIAIIAMTVVFSVLGDLFESLIKREQGVKDSSSLLPGHGGVMDRIDSLTAAAPIFAFSVFVTGWPVL